MELRQLSLHCQLSAVDLQACVYHNACDTSARKQGGHRIGVTLRGQAVEPAYLKTPERLKKRAAPAVGSSNQWRPRPVNTFAEPNQVDRSCGPWLGHDRKSFAARCGRVAHLCGLLQHGIFVTQPQDESANCHEMVHYLARQRRAVYGMRFAPEAPRHIASNCSDFEQPYGAENGAARPAAMPKSNL